MRKNTRVYLSDDPMNIGTVRVTESGKSLVFWDCDFNERGKWIAEDDPEDRWYPTSHLRSANGKRQSNPPAVYAPEVQDLEFVTRLHPISHSLVMERHEGFRGGPGPAVVDAADVYELFNYMSELDQEHIVVLLLDVRHNLLGWKMCHKGEIASVNASVKDMLKDAMLINAAKVIVIHNHPSGDPGPSDADRDLTKALETMGHEFNIELFDHVIIGRADPENPDFTPYYSFRDAGEIEEVVDEDH